MAPVEPEEEDHSPLILQARDVHIELRAIDTLQFLLRR